MRNLNDPRNPRNPLLSDIYQMKLMTDENLKDTWVSKDAQSSQTTRMQAFEPVCPWVPDWWPSCWRSHPIAIVRTDRPSGCDGCRCEGDTTELASKTDGPTGYTWRGCRRHQPLSTRKCTLHAYDCPWRSACIHSVCMAGGVGALRKSK